MTVKIKSFSTLTTFLCGAGVCMLLKIVCVKEKSGKRHRFVTTLHSIKESPN